MALDFAEIIEEPVKKGLNKIEPSFLMVEPKDMMIHAGDFYAIWDEENGRWSTSETDVTRIIDKLQKEYLQEAIERRPDAAFSVSWMRNANTGTIDRFHHYVQRQLRDNYRGITLDPKLIFKNQPTTRDDFSSKTLPYALEPGNCSAWDEIVSTLYFPEQRHKIEWSIGAVVVGDSRFIQKCTVFYGPPGTGKTTILDIIEMLFKGYTRACNIDNVGSKNSQFPLEDFRDNPLVAISQDGDLSLIQTNSYLNSLISHDIVSVNVKHKSSYPMRFNTYLFVGTNKPVKITDAKSGLLRRVIDVHPTGRLIPRDRYDILKNQIKFELGAIAYKCREVYLENPKAYDGYVPNLMMGATNPFYNFILDNWEQFDTDEDMDLDIAYRMYNSWCDTSNMEYKFNKMKFKEELKNYYEDFIERDKETGKKNIYRHFQPDKFQTKAITARIKPKENPTSMGWIDLKVQHSLLDDELKDMLAQLSITKPDGSQVPKYNWDNVHTRLSDIDTTLTHYTMMPTYHIVVDFDKKDEKGGKSLEKNLEAASKWPATYCEVSKGGEGLHLHYYYQGDVSELARLYEHEIEIKVFTGHSSLRRRLSLCNDLPIATITSGLPMKEVKNVVKFEGLKNDRAVHTFVTRALQKEYSAGTYHTIQFIKSALDEVYESGIVYDVNDLKKDIILFASQSSNHSYQASQMALEIHYNSEQQQEALDDSETEEAPIVFVDVEVFPNLFVVCFKRAGTKYPLRYINPTAEQVQDLFRFRLIGFNNRDYDNHILYAASMKYTNEMLYDLSQKIINSKKGENVKFRDAYNLSYTDIYDYSSDKMSLKKWEIKLGIHHQELGFHWDQPVDEEYWDLVADYCCNDVEATEAVWEATQADFKAREMLVALCHAFGCPACVNDKTNTLTQRIIFGNEKRPQPEFNWRDMAKPVKTLSKNMLHYLKKRFTKMMEKPFDGPLGKSYLPYYPEYRWDWVDEKNENTGKSKRVKGNLFKNVNLGKGGLVQANHGMYGRAKTYDVASMHPTSLEAEYLFGKYTERFTEIKNARILIKHGDYEGAKQLLGGVLAPFLDNEEDAANVAQALKIAINAVYGMTSASFENPFKDPRNENNIVALRGALFMFDLKCKVEELGYTVIHIKTDSIKIADPDDAIEQFVMEYGERYGYDFEIEHIFEKICLVNNAVYIAKLATDDPDWIKECKKAKKKAEETGTPYVEPTRWTATGTQFAVPYVFKTLFSKEPIKFEDLCMTFSTKTALYLDINESLSDVADAEKEAESIQKILTKAAKENAALTNDTAVMWKRMEYRVGELKDRLVDLENEIEAGHDMHFIGKVGQFVPVVEGVNGGYLKRQQDDKFNTVGGAGDYRWLESEAVIANDLQDKVDFTYFEELVVDAIENLSNYGDPNVFCER